MTDLEIHKRCAKAMGLKCYIDADGDFCLLEQLDINGGSLQYRPLYDNDQCFELIDRFGLITDKNENNIWNVRGWFNIGKTPDFSIRSNRSNDNLNRAVCECVANIAR